MDYEEVATDPNQQILQSDDEPKDLQTNTFSDDQEK